MSKDMETSKKLTSPEPSQLILFAEDSPASPSPAPGTAGVTKTLAGYGPNFTAPFAKLVPAGSWLKMCQGFCRRTLDGSLEEYSETWPPAGIMRNGTCYRQPPLVPRTSDFGYFLWPTPEAASALGGQTSRGGKRKGELLLGGMVKLWPTPTARLGSQRGPQAKRYWDPKRSNDLDDAVAASQLLPTPSYGDYRSGAGYSHEGKKQTPQLRHLSGGQLNPTWVEWLMGFPLGWTALNASATPLSPRLPNGSADE